MGSFMMKIDDISRKALQRLYFAKKPPTPKAYFDMFYEMAKLDGWEQIEELNWQMQWLNKFDKTEQEQLKKARNPDEFIEIAALLLRESKQNCSIEHLQSLKALIRKLLGTISDMFSIGAKNRYAFLFRLSSINQLEDTQKLVKYWEQFRASKMHIETLKRLTNIIAHTLRELDSQGKVSKEALELSSVLMMHPEMLVESRMLDGIEKLLGIKSSSKAEALYEDKEMLQSGCVAAFKVVNLDFSNKERVDIKEVNPKAMEILKKLCLNGLKNGFLVGDYKNGFALMFKGIDTQSALEQISPIAKQLEKQKFSYQGSTFTFSFELKVFDLKTFTSLKDMNEKLSHLLSEGT